MTCELLRLNAVYIHNSAMGRKKKDQIQDPKKIARFGWEAVTGPRKTPEEMKGMLQAIAAMYGPKRPKPPKKKSDGDE